MTSEAIVLVTFWLTIVHLLGLKGFIHFLKGDTLI
jgi:hypothetical protein